MQVLGATLKGEVPRGVAVRAAVVHMHVKVAAPPATGRQVRQPLERQPLGHGPSRRDHHVRSRHAVFRSVPHFHPHRPGRCRHLGRTGGVEVPVFERAVGPVLAIERLIGMPPGVVRCIGPPVRAGHRNPRGERAARCVHDDEAQTAHGTLVASLRSDDLSPLSARHVDHPQSSVPACVRDVGDVLGIS